MLHASRIVGVAQLLFESGDYFVQHFRRCGHYSRAATNRERRLIEQIWYLFMAGSVSILRRLAGALTPSDDQASLKIGELQ